MYYVLKSLYISAMKLLTSLFGCGWPAWWSIATWKFEAKLFKLFPHISTEIEITEGDLFSLYELWLYFQQLFAESKVNIAEYLPRRNRGKYSAILTEPEGNNCFSIIFKGECEKLEEKSAKHEKQMSLSLAIVPRNPTITARAVIIMQNCYIHLWKLHQFPLEVQRSIILCMIYVTYH